MAVSICRFQTAKLQSRQDLCGLPGIPCDRLLKPLFRALSSDFADKHRNLLESVNYARLQSTTNNICASCDEVKTSVGLLGDDHDMKVEHVILVSRLALMGTVH